MNKKRCGWPLLAGLVVLMVHPVAAARTVDQRLANQVAPDFLAQGERVDITHIQVEETATGLTLQLVTNGALTIDDPVITGNAVLVTIPNAGLRLADGDEFVASGPADGIAQINVTSLPDNQVQIAITGTDAAPDLEISTAATGLLVSVTPGMPTVQASDQAPENDTLRLVVTGEEEDGYFTPDASTATRTDTPPARYSQLDSGNSPSGD